MEKTIHIEGMSCSHCKAAVEKALSSVSGVTRAEVNLEKKLAKVSGQGLDEQAMKEAVIDAGYEVTGME
ncbi:MAG: heavy-metal-associated domain-containing protein [Clostridiales bacterium]|nr:heavy-metal-associated domain-containing protein [Clostridiales bacterium]